MLEGLEISILNFSEIHVRNERLRFDSEFFKKEYLTIENKLENIGFKRLSDIEYFIKHPSEIKREYVEDGVWFFRTQNIRPLKIELSNQVFISKIDAEKLKNNLIKYNDIVITRTGANFGQTAIYNLEKTAIGSSHTFILKNNFFNQSYLAVFLNTKFGRKLIDKGMYGGSQPEIAPYYLSNIPIPNFKLKFQRIIEQLILASESSIGASKQTYTKAETILLEEIGLLNFTQSKEPVNIKSFKESFGVTGRLDAEYYQIKYEQVIEKIIAQKHNSLINIVDISKSIEPGSNHYSEDKGLPFYRVADFNKFGLSKPDKELTTSFVAENITQIEKLKPKKGSILFSKDGSVGTAYLLREDLDGITSGAILQLKIKKFKEILPEYLTLALNSKLVQMQAERDAGGSIILHWRKEEIEQVVVPIIEFKKQEQIAELVEESFKLKAESERLLEVAKKAVEMAIEQSEEIAMAYINENLK